MTQECEHHQTFMKGVKDDLDYIREKLDTVTLDHETRITGIEASARMAKWIFGAIIALVATAVTIGAF